MKRRVLKSFCVSLALLMVSGFGAYVSTDQSAKASINPDNYGVDVFPSKQTHNRFAYQLRNRGHNGRIYYSKRNSKLGRALFNEGVPNNDYSNYLFRRHPKLYKSIVKRLARNGSKHTPRVKRYNHKVRKGRRNKKNKPRQRLLKSRFKRSNSKRRLKRSGFYDAHAIGGNFIFDKYAPNDKRAVVPKQAKVNNWYKGKFGQKKPTAYEYVPKAHGWKIVK